MAAKKGSRGGKPIKEGSAHWSRRNAAPVLFLSVEDRGSFKDASDLLDILISFQCKESLAKATETTLVFRNDDRNLAEDPRFLANSIWKFRFGYFNDLSPIMVGIVRNVEPDYSAKCTLAIKLFDHSLNASQTSKGKNWGKIQSSEIAKAIAKSHGLKHRVTDSGDVPKKAWIQPADMVDLMYLRDLAAMIDFELYVEGDPPTLVYRKKAYDSAPKANLTYFSDPSEFSYLKSFKPKVTSLGAYSSGAANTDAGKGKADKSSSKDPTGRSPALAAANPMEVQLSAKTGATRANFDVVSKKPVVTPAPSNTNTKQLAEVKRQQMLDKANEASSDHPLTPALAKGLIFNIFGVDKPLEGKWYVQEAHHDINGTSASTKVTWKRNATGGKKDLKNQNNKDADNSKSNNPVVQLNGTSSTNLKLTVVSPVSPKK